MENLTKGTSFNTMKEAKECITFYCVRNKLKFIVKRSCAKKYSVVCKARECGFCISCFKNRHDIVKVTKFVLDHRCGHRVDGNVSVKTAYIARTVRALIADKPAMTVAEIMVLMKQQDGIDVPYWAAWKGRKLALTHICGSSQLPSTDTESQLHGRQKRLRSRNIRGPGRKCSNCGIIAHHNARTCERRQQASLLPTLQHPEVLLEELLEDDSLSLKI
jgi:hypothetical protein